MYLPQEPTSIETLEQLQDYLASELSELSRLSAETIELELRPRARAPERPREGMLVYDDGTNWALHGEGLYVYNGTTWVRCAGDNENNVFTLSQMINANAVALPTPFGGTLLQIGNADDVNTRLVLNAFGTGIPTLNFARARGTNASPTALANNSQFAIFGGYGYDGSAYANGNRARITFAAAEAWASGAHGSYVTFDTTPIGSTTIAERVRISDAGAIQMGGANTVISAARHPTLRSYTVAALPAGNLGEVVWASNCRVFNGAGVQEGAGAGTGGMVTYNGAAWKIAGTNVTAVA